MDVKDAVEQAYKNGYEDGKKETARDILTQIDNDLHKLAIRYDECGKPLYFAVCENVYHTVVSPLAKKYGVDLGEEK